MSPEEHQGLPALELAVDAVPLREPVGERGEVGVDGLEGGQPVLEADVADGAVVGSALIDTMARTIADGGNEELATENAIGLLRSIRNGVDDVTTGV